MLHLIFAKRRGGKTTFCLTQMKAAYDTHQKAALLIPEQLSLETEGKVIDKIGFVGEGVEVFSFNRLFRRLYDKSNRPKRQFIDDVGKTMLISRILKKHSSDFIIFKSSASGNLGLLSAISEFKRHFADKNSLKKASEIFESSLSRQKFLEFSRLLEYYDNSLSENNADSDDNLTLIPDLLNETDCLSDYTFYADGFDGFTPQEAGVLISLAKKTEVYVTFSYDKNRPFLFEPIKRAKDRLIRFAESQNVAVSEKFLSDFTKNLPPSLLHLNENYGNFKSSPYLNDQNSIHIFSCDTPYSETDAVARRIINLTKQGLRFRDITVCVPDISSYLSIFDKVFSDYSIPFFADRRDNISEHPLCRLIVALCELFVQNFSVNSVMSFLKNDYIPIDRSDVDKLEFYVSKTGLNGSDYQKEWVSSPDCSFDLRELNKTREQFLNIVMPFREKTKGKTSCSVFSDCFIEFLKEIKADKTTNERISDLSSYEKQTEVQIFKSVLHVIEQLKTTFGDESMGIENIKNILSSGFMCSTVGKIPPTLDHVTISTTDRNNFSSPQAMFIMGVTEGSFPKTLGGSGMISDAERMVLSENGIVLSDTNRTKALNLPFTSYMTITSPDTLLCLSYPVESKSGEGVLPASIIGDIKRMFPKIKEVSELAPSDSAVISTPKSTLSYFLRRAKKDTIWEQVYWWYLKDGTYKVNRYLSAKNYTLSWKISEETAKRLWGKSLYTTISRLEKFASCPLSFFLTYGLKLNKMEENTFSPPEAGNMMHSVMENFIKSSLDQNLDFDSLTFEDTKKRTLELCDEVIEKQISLFPSVTKKYSFLISRIRTATVNAVWAVVHHIQAGVFKPICAEFEFKDETAPVFITDRGNKLVLSGKIDRIDASDEGYRIIDYKSSAKDLDLSAVKSGRSLQLPIYSYALKDKFGNPRGMFYLAVEPKLIERDMDFSLSEPDGKLLNQYRLSGYTVGEKEDLLKMDMNMGTYSSVIHASNSKSGGLKSSSLLNFDEYQKVENFAIAKVKEFGDKILMGQYPILPVETDSVFGCKYCEFASVCRFDSAYCSSRKEESKTDDELLERGEE